MRFEIGEQIVCIKKDGWTYGGSNPKFNEIVTVVGYDLTDPIPGENYLFIKEHLSYQGKKCSYYEMCFAPILNNLDEIKEVLKKTVEI